MYEGYGLFQNVLHQDWLPLKILQKKYQMSGKLKLLTFMLICTRSFGCLLTDLLCPWSSTKMLSKTDYCCPEYEFQPLATVLICTRKCDCLLTEKLFIIIPRVCSCVHGDCLTTRSQGYTWKWSSWTQSLIMDR